MSRFSIQRSKISSIASKIQLHRHRNVSVTPVVSGAGGTSSRTEGSAVGEEQVGSVEGPVITKRRQAVRRAREHGEWAMWCVMCQVAILYQSKRHLMLLHLEVPPIELPSSRLYSEILQ